MEMGAPRLTPQGDEGGKGQGCAVSQCSLLGRDVALGEAVTGPHTGTMLLQSPEIMLLFLQAVVQEEGSEPRVNHGSSGAAPKPCPCDNI